MKKITALVLAGMMALSLAACGGSSNGGNTTTTVAANEKATTAGTYTYDLKGTTIAANAEMAPIVEKLGDPDSYFESESCAFQGLDKVYTYGGVKITTYPKDNVDYVNIIELMDDTESTPEGISIGSATGDVSAAYGEPTKTTDTSMVYEKGDCTLSFIFEGDSVSAITYTAITE